MADINYNKGKPALCTKFKDFLRNFIFLITNIQWKKSYYFKVWDIFYGFKGIHIVLNLLEIQFRT